MRKNIKIYRLALGGLMLALSIISLIIPSVIPGIQMTAFAITSLFVIVMVAESGVKGGLLIYGGTIILGLVLVPSKLLLIPYALFFGIYGIFKYYLEKISHRFLQIVAKLALFYVIFAIGILFLKKIIFGNLNIMEKIPFNSLPLLIIGAGMVFIAYDIILSGVIKMYRKRILREGEFKLSK